MYNLRQIFECEQKIRLTETLKIPISNKEIELLLHESHFEEMNKEENVEKTHNGLDNVEIDEEETKKCDAVIPVIAYIAGYCCFKIIKKLECSECKIMLCSNSNDDRKIFENKKKYIAGISRGALLYPSETTMNIVMYCYIVANKLLSDVNILKSKNLRRIIIDTTINVLCDNAIQFPSNACSVGHSYEKSTEMILWATCNILVNNFCKRENDLMIAKKCAGRGKKRKLETLRKC